MFSNGGNSAPLGGWTVPRPVFKRLQVIPSEGPVDPLFTLNILRTHLRQPSPLDDDYLKTVILPTAVDAVEQYISRTLITKNLRMWMDFIPGMGRDDSYNQNGVIEAPVSYSGGTSFRWFDLMSAPVTEVTSINFITDAGDEVVFDDANYIADFSDPDANARIILQRGSVWPTDLRVAKSLFIDYKAGYGAATDVPASLKHAVLLIATALYTNRGDSADAQDMVLHFPAITALLNPYRIIKIGTL